MSVILSSVNGYIGVIKEKKHAMIAKYQVICRMVLVSVNWWSLLFKTNKKSQKVSTAIV